MSTFVTPVLSKLEQQVGFGDPKVEINALDRYKGRKGVIDRISLVGKQLMRGNSHFFNQKKFRCLTEQVDKMNNLFLATYVKLQSLLNREEGQDLVEYALLVCLIALAAITGVKAVASAVTTVFTTISTSLGAA